MVPGDQAIRDTRTTESRLRELEDRKRQRMAEKSSLRGEAKMHPPQASAKRREIDPLEVKRVCNIKHLIRGGGERWIRTRDTVFRTPWFTLLMWRFWRLRLGRAGCETSVPVRAQSRQAAVPVRDRRGGRDLHPRILQGQTPRSAESIAQAGRQGRQAGSVGGADPPVIVARDRTGATIDAVLTRLDAASITAALGQVITRPAELCCDGAAITAFARRARGKFHVLPPAAADPLGTKVPVGTGTFV